MSIVFPNQHAKKNPSGRQTNSAISRFDLSPLFTPPDYKLRKILETSTAQQANYVQSEVSAKHKIANLSFFTLEKKNLKIY